MYGRIIIFFLKPCCIEEFHTIYHGFQQHKEPWCTLHKNHDSEKPGVFANYDVYTWNHDVWNHDVWNYDVYTWNHDVYNLEKSLEKFGKKVWFNTSWFFGVFWNHDVLTLVNHDVYTLNHDVYTWNHDVLTWNYDVLTWNHDLYTVNHDV